MPAAVKWWVRSRGNCRLTSVWEPGTWCLSCIMVMVMKMLLSGISRPVNWGINRVCPNRNNQACILQEEEESQYQMHHKQDDCDTWRWRWWEQGPCPVTYPERYHFPQLAQVTSQLFWTTDALLLLSEEPVFHCPPLIQALKSYSHLQKKWWCRCAISLLWTTTTGDLVALALQLVMDLSNIIPGPGCRARNAELKNEQS